MRHKNKVKTLDRTKEARELMLRNLASSIIIYEKVKTSQAKAKAVKPLVERIITISKKGDLSARRSLLKIILQPKAVKKTMEVLSERYKERSGGYCRIINIGARKGDGAQIVQIELV
jgi:large subunit ribosomal protein L17